MGVSSLHIAPEDREVQQLEQEWSVGASVRHFSWNLNGFGVTFLPENRSRIWSLIILYSFNVTIIFIGFTASQQESNKSWISTFPPKQEYESNFVELEWIWSQKIQTPV